MSDVVEDIAGVDPAQVTWQVRTGTGGPFPCRTLDELSRRLTWLDMEDFTATIPTAKDVIQPLIRTLSGETIQLGSWTFGRLPASGRGHRTCWVRLDDHTVVEGTSWWHALRNLVPVVWPDRHPPSVWLEGQ